MIPRTFSKGERICSKRDIDLLFQKGTRVSVGNLTLRRVERDSRPGEYPFMVLVVVPKKRVPHAVDRNRVKRRLREIYRLHKDALPQSKPGITTLLGLMYTGGKDMDSAKTRVHYLKALERLKPAHP